MKRSAVLLIAILLTIGTSAQMATGNNLKFFWDAKEFSKDVALFHSKQFLFTNVLGVSTNTVQFEVIPLAAASSGELTTLLYNCNSKKKEGLVLGFFGTYRNNNGFASQVYAYKNLEKEKATEFLTKIQKAIEDNTRYLKGEDNNNIYFSYDDIDVLICNGDDNRYLIRLFWNGFDSSWEQTAFQHSKKRFERNLK
ncbi:hypothetical protein [Pinibacter soli]|uniref:DUF4252 domain-containing protein n=1 Tax=Pinibacter soli TaxID=3044211 RepID=A0ABT6RAL1_9BACT|nr:hypothetical protein [Pinibacter soli]MDI3319440.1 hypothetical protein [Pinibacter soli]